MASSPCAMAVFSRTDTWMLGKRFFAAWMPLFAAELKVPSVIGPGSTSATLSARLGSGFACANAALGSPSASASKMMSVRMSFPLFAQPGEHFVARRDVAELLDMRLERRAVLLVGQRGTAVGKHDHFEVEHHRVARGRFAADVGLGTGDQEGVDAQIAQDPLERRGSRHQRAVAVLDHNQVFRRG